jgi:hypothetical protein
MPSTDVPPGEQLRAAISIVSSAAADRGWGSADAVRVRSGGRVQIGAQADVVDAATVYQAARGLVGALIDDLLQVTDRELAELVGPWLAVLEMREAVADLDLGDLDLGAFDVDVDESAPGRHRPDEPAGA